MEKRHGMALVEVLVVLAIVATLAAQMLPAIMKARDTAIRVQSQNRQRQLILAVHNFSSVHDGRLPSIDGNPQSANYRGVSFFGAIYDYVEDSDRMFISPADPTLDANWHGACSCAANGQLFVGDPSLARSIPDGTAYTIALAEHYSRCQQISFDWSFTTAGGVRRRATFADKACGDVVPVTSANGAPQNQPSWPGETFQVAPSTHAGPGLNMCWFGVAQTPHRSGMLIALADGSCRLLAGDVDPFVYWGAVTPARGEIPGDF